MGATVACWLGLTFLFGFVEQKQDLTRPACADVAECGKVGELTAWRYQYGSVFGFGQRGDPEIIGPIRDAANQRREEFCASRT